MKSILKIFLIILAASFFLILVFLFRIQPSIKIWEQYKVFYFPSDYSLYKIKTAINDENLLQAIIFENPDYHHAWVNIMQAEENYDTVRDFSQKYMRDFFFYDKTGSYRIIYVPDDISSDLISSLKASGISFGTDSVNKYPYLYPIISFVFLILLALFGKMSFFHSVSAVPLILFTLWCPFYNSAVGVLSALFGFYTAEQYAGKKYGITRTFLNPVVIICLLFSLFSITAGGIKLLLLFLSTLVSSILLWISLVCLNKISLSAYHFRYVPILTSKSFYPYKRVTFFSISMVAVAATVLALFFFLSAGIIRSTGEDDLYLPSPSEYTESVGINSSSYSELKEFDSREYPDTADFIDEYWLNIRSQYSRLSDNYSSEDITPGDIIAIPVFTEDTDGIHSELRTIESFDDKFIDKLTQEFIGNGGAEQFLFSQGKMFSTKYVKAGDRSHDLNSALSIISLFVLFVILFILRLIKGCKK
ncbi:MAG: hypothetical protein K5930_11030 [Treponemataceae bacterium]|nr:hypothetical protein [Treponemataceae bacterium]